MCIFRKLSGTRKQQIRCGETASPKYETRRPPLNSRDDLHELFHSKVYFVFRSRMYCPFCQVNYALSAVRRKLRGEVFLDELWGLARSTLA